MKKTKIFFWVTTIIIFLFEGVLPAFTSHTEFAKEGIRHLGYPEYFGVMLAVFKVCGSLVLIIPKISWRLKEWAYAGFAFDFVAAMVSIWVVDGFGAGLVLPVIFLLILTISYTTYHKLDPALNIRSVSS
jgi:hypothetical protein